MTEKEKIDALRPRLTDEFVSTLIEAVRICGWNVDHIESSRFVANVLYWAGIENSDLTPYEFGDDE